MNLTLHTHDALGIIFQSSRSPRLGLGLADSNNHTCSTWIHMTVEHTGIFYIHIVLYSYLRGEERAFLEMMMGEREERIDCISRIWHVYIHST